MAEEEIKEAPKKSEKCCCDCRVFLISLLTSIIVVLSFYIGVKAFKILCASCSRGKAPAAVRCCCCRGGKFARPGMQFCGPRPGFMPPPCGPMEGKFARPMKKLPPPPAKAPAPAPAPAK